MQVELFHCCFMRKYRPIRVDGDLAYITLTKGYEAVIDAADVHLVDGFNWHAKPDQRTVYAIRTSCHDGVKRTVYMHRLLLQATDDIEVDHKDGDGLNNRRSSNLRAATKSKNMHNSGLFRNNKSGIKGVTFDKESGKWKAHIAVHRKQNTIGRYDTLELAYQARCEASKRLHGEFARDATRLP